jgi:threonine dehydrogenase-like Zn-dependent dehydrogenase
METAVSLVMDGDPMIGERAVVFGQGVVGLLTVTLLSRHPVSTVFAVEPMSGRRVLATEWGADRAFDPSSGLQPLHDKLNIQGTEAPEVKEETYEGADLVYELSGEPSVLNDALSVTGYNGQIVVGSWYGSKEAPIGLGGRFHRSRIQVKSSQVSSIAPAIRGRWTKSRRMNTVLELLQDVRPGDLITASYSLEEAEKAYGHLMETDTDALQPIFQHR